MRIAALALAVCVAGPAEAAECVPADDAQIAIVRQGLERDLRDAASARFADICRYEFTHESGEAIVAYCGQVNARNAFGAFTGHTPFTFREGAKSGAIYADSLEPMDKAMFAYGWCQLCEQGSDETCTRAGKDALKADLGAK